MAHSGDRPHSYDEWMRRVEQTQASHDERIRTAATGYTAASVPTVTDSNGYASFLFGRSYPAPPVVNVSGGNGEQVTKITDASNPGLSGFTARFLSPTGQVLANAQVRCDWIALPSTF